jgi:toxin ParE1/3/4
MSAPNLKARLSTAAQQNYDDILLYGIRHWGEAQAKQYKQAVDDALHQIGQFPEIGRRRDEWFWGCRSLLIERHIVFYWIDRDEIAVVNILHERSDPRLHVVP